MSQGFVEDILNEIADMTSELDPLVVGGQTLYASAVLAASRHHLEF